MEISHINEFLVQMENFNGVLICCTNLLEIFDTASMRRFNWKIRFSPLKEEMRVPLYERYFVTENTPITAGQKRRISSIKSLTPGHARAVSRRIAYIDGEAIEHDTIINELEKEASYMQIRKDKRVGFD
jgi:AAA+ superfamily predicted ATPase